MKYGFDDIVAISKDAVDKITGKANEAVNVSKAYVERAQLRVKLKERYYELGKVCYSMHRDSTDETGNMKRLIKEIKMLEAQLEFAEDASGKPHVCEFCGAKKAPDKTYCCKCGEKL
ncbi:MAG: hypothetical protein L6V87_06230 [Ruminococcus sp.]|nr:MAG: hypothetical protein L6V87_06230 [Ruminococcus sp.]